MSKTWETLFQLSSFMKFLMAEVIPGENLESPSYLLESLYDLLTVTISCIEKVKTNSGDVIKMKNDIAERSALEILSSRNHQKLIACKSLLQDKSCAATSNLPIENKPQQTSNFSGSHNNSHNSITSFPKTDQQRAESDAKADINHFEVNKSTSLKAKISSTFLKMDRQMHLGCKTGFFCGICDMDFYKVEEWTRHFQQEVIHTTQTIDSSRQIMCSCCKLVIFAPSPMLVTYRNLHMNGHNQNKEIRSSNDEHFVNNGSQAGQSNIFKMVYTNPNFNKDKMCGKNLNISNKFKKLDVEIHNTNLQGYFYCILCQLSFNPIDSMKHMTEEKHLQAIKLTNGAKWKGTCSYCSLIFVGIRKSVRLYMEYHNEGHKKPISFYEEKLSPLKTAKNSKANILSQRHQSNSLHKCDRQNNSTSFCLEYHNSSKNKSNFKGSISEQNTRSNPLSTLADSEKGEEKDIVVESKSTWRDGKDNSTSNNNFPSYSKIPAEKSLFNLSKLEQLQHIVFEQVSSKIEQKKNTTEEMNYFAFCMACEKTFESAFEWEDHLIDGDHSSRSKLKDRQAEIKALNIAFYGNEDILKQCKAHFNLNLSYN